MPSRALSTVGLRGSPLQEMRLLNEYNAKLVAFLRRLRRAGYDVKAGEELASEGVHDNSTVVVSWG